MSIDFLGGSAPLLPASMPAVNMAASRWRFAGNAAAIRSLAATWARLAESASHGQAIIGRAATPLMENWQDDASNAYQAHRRRLDPDILTIAEASDQVVVALEAAADAVVAAQVRLAGLLAVAGGLGQIDHGNDVITFHPTDQGAADELNALAGQADEARITAEHALDAAAGAIDGCLAGLDRVGGSWAPRPGADGGRGAIMTSAPGRVYWDPLAGEWRVELEPGVLGGMGEPDPGGGDEPNGGDEPAGGEAPAHRSALQPVIGLHAGGSIAMNNSGSDDDEWWDPPSSPPPEGLPPVLPPLGQDQQPLWGAPPGGWPPLEPPLVSP